MRSTLLYVSADAVEEAFYAALRRADLAALLGLWSEHEEVVCVHPGGARLVGLDPVRQSWSEILANGGLEVRCAEVHRVTGAAMSVHNVVEEIVVRGERDARVVRCAATNIYVKDPQGWRLVLHHASALGDAEEAAATPTGTVLH